MNTEDWTASHLGKKVKIKSERVKGWHYRLEALKYDGGSGGVTATVISIVPSKVPGTISHFDLSRIELA